MAKYPDPDVGSEEEEDLSDIDDDEISGCLNDKRLADLKAKAWNLMHCQYTNRKRDPENQPADARKKAKTGSSAAARKDNEKKAKPTPSLSSKIDYEALKKFTDEEAAGGEKDEGEREGAEKVGFGEDGDEEEEEEDGEEDCGDGYGNDYQKEEEEEESDGDGYSENEDDDDYELY